MYKSIRDALRYRQKKITGKSGDSGDELMDDETQSNKSKDSKLLDSLAFLTPTTSKFSRQTIGGTDEAVSVTSANSDTEMDNVSTYSYVIFLNDIFQWFYGTTNYFFPLGIVIET